MVSKPPPDRKNSPSIIAYRKQLRQNKQAGKPINKPERQHFEYRTRQIKAIAAAIDLP